MKTEVEEVQISVKDPSKGYGAFAALIRDGELEDMDNIKEGKSWEIPSCFVIKAYIQFLQEILTEIEEE